MAEEKSERPDENGLTSEEEDQVEDHLRLRAPVVYEVVAQEGEAELARPAASLWWSGIAAGLSIGFSVLAEGILHTHLPDAPWRPLVENFGYCVGFLIVILARQQLFTENTITPILPVIADRSWATCSTVARLWGIVFAANIVGTALFAAFCTYTVAVSGELYAAMLDISRHMMENGWWAMLAKGIVSGWLIAALVWILPSAEGAEFWVITLLTWLIAAGDFTHVVAGSVEAFLLVITGELGIVAMIWQFTLPVLLGNVIGGTVLFALIAYAQVMEEM